MALFDSLKKLFAAKPKTGGKRKRAKFVKVEVIKRFEIRGRSGQGSMSKVFQAYDNKIGRAVCLKLLDKEKTASFEERFSKQGLDKPSEGEVCSVLKHKNLVLTYEHGLTTHDEPFLVMEWIDGKGLNYLIESRSKQLDGKRIDYLCQLCDAVEYLHRQKYIHRDLCPRNVMVNEEGIVKLIDFGLTIPYTPDFCKPGNRTGTSDYLAPEVIKRRSTDHRVDLFALGVTAFEILTGHLPWERALSSQDTIQRHLNSPPRKPKDVNPDLDEEASDLLIKAIALEPMQRFPSARAFKEALEALRRQDY